MSKLTPWRGSIGTPFSSTATRVLFCGAGELGKEVVIELKRLGCEVIAREDGYTYIAALRSPDLRHTTKREGDTSVTVVTSNFVLLKLFLYQPGTKKVYCVVQVVLNRLENSTQCVLPLTMVRNKPTPHKYRPEKIR